MLYLRQIPIFYFDPDNISFVIIQQIRFYHEIAASKT